MLEGSNFPNAEALAARLTIDQLAKIAMDELADGIDGFAVSGSNHRWIMLKEAYLVRRRFERQKKADALAKLEEWEGVSPDTKCSILKRRLDALEQKLAQGKPECTCYDGSGSHDAGCPMKACPADVGVAKPNPQ